MVPDTHAQLSLSSLDCSKVEQMQTGWYYQGKTAIPQLWTTSSQAVFASHIDCWESLLTRTAWYQSSQLWLITGLPYSWSCAAEKLLQAWTFVIHQHCRPGAGPLWPNLTAARLSAFAMLVSWKHGVAWEPPPRCLMRRWSFPNTDGLWAPGFW